MRAQLFVWIVLLFAVGCAANARPILPTPTAIRLPPTWTPAPTATAPPPGPTATLVIPSTPVDPNLSVETIRRFPAPTNNTIGEWVDTTHLSNDVLRPLSARIQLAIGPQANLMRQTNPRVISLERIDSAPPSDSGPLFPAVIDAGYDGVLMENLGTGASTEASAASDNLLASARAALGPRLIIADTDVLSGGNALAEHSPEAASLLGRVDGVCLCSFLRVSTAPLAPFKNVTEWKKDVDSLGSLSSYPYLVVLVATRFDHVTDDDRALLQRWFDYSLASFLIGEYGSYAYFSFQGPLADGYMGGGELDLALGPPVGAYYPSFGMYARHFQHGLVIVNSGDAEREMPLGRLYTTTAGEEITSIRLEAYTGKILLTEP